MFESLLLIPVAALAGYFGFRLGVRRTIRHRLRAGQYVVLGKRLYKKAKDGSIRVVGDLGA